MGVEIERKFRVADMGWRAAVTQSTRFSQGYLSRDPARTVRVRIAGDAAFLSHVGASGLSTIFLSLPAVMLVYTPIFALLLGRLGVGRLVEITLWLLVAGGAAFAFLLTTAKPPVWAFHALRLAAQCSGKARFVLAEFLHRQDFTQRLADHLCR